MKSFLVLCVSFLLTGCFLDDEIKIPTAEKIIVKVSTDITECQMDNFYEALDYFNNLWNIEDTAFKVIVTTPEDIKEERIEQWRTIYVDFDKHPRNEGSEDEYYCVNPITEEDASCYIGLGGMSYYYDNPENWIGHITIQKDHCPLDDASLNVWLHEFGHVFTLEHVEAEDDDENIMNPQVHHYEAFFTEEQIAIMKNFALIDEDLENEK